MLIVALAWLMTPIALVNCFNSNNGQTRYDAMRALSWHPSIAQWAAAQKDPECRLLAQTAYSRYEGRNLKPLSIPMAMPRP